MSGTSSFGLVEPNFTTLISAMALSVTLVIGGKC
jgi:hypothetical protein